MLDKKQIRAIFLSSKCKAVETAHNINDAFDPRTAKECTVVDHEVLQRRQEP